MYVLLSVSTPDLEDGVSNQLRNSVNWKNSVEFVIMTLKHGLYQVSQ